MSTWTSPTILPPEIEVLVRRWKLPTDRIDDVKQLLAARDEGGTACPLPGTTPTHAEAWGEACRVMGITRGSSEPPAIAPLVLRHHDHRPYLQSWRLFTAEEAIAREVLARAQRPAPPLTRSAVSLLKDLGPEQVNERQAAALRCGLDHTLAIVVGGPGTGKTHTLARLLALLIAERPHTPPIIRLAAPTGKAADRMKEAVEAAADRLPSTLPTETKAILKDVAASASTLHRLLGFNPSTGKCRVNAVSKLRSDVVIVDECSMVDTLLWQALLTALEPTTRLILVGDPNQLESISAGDVLGSLVRFARAHSGSALDQVCIELTESQRFRHRPGIGSLATAVVDSDADAAAALLGSHQTSSQRAAPLDGLGWLGDHANTFAWERLPASVQLAITAVADAVSPTEALDALARVRLLTAHREHSLGAQGLNDSIHRHLLQRPGVKRAPNQPIIVNRNDPETGLTNGSVGVVMEVDGLHSAFFPPAAKDTPPRKVALGRLPDTGAAWAMTIHRSQGSEFDEVVVVLPQEESPLATRELIYTAITRARQWVYVWGSEATVRAALAEKALRCTLLEASLETLSPPTLPSPPKPTTPTKIIQFELPL
jgi:exodeoxyribonuclease V alpha subunit